MQSTLFLPAILASLLTLLSDISFYACIYAKSQECAIIAALLIIFISFFCEKSEWAKK